MTVHQPPPDILAACRETLARQRNRSHWHGGPDSCPSCGALPTKQQKPATRPAQLRLAHNQPNPPDGDPERHA